MNKPVCFDFIANNRRRNKNRLRNQMFSLNRGRKINDKSGISLHINNVNLQMPFDF